MKIKTEKIKKEFIRKGSGTNIFTAVHETDMELPEGNLIVIKGRSGSGKSTLLNMISGILSPTSGKVFYDDKDIYQMKDDELSIFRNRNIGYIPQGNSAISSLDLMENIMLPLMLGDAVAEEIQNAKKRAQSYMEVFGIEHLKGAKMQELSGGEMRRMAIARALIMEPHVVFADEPTGDLDDENTKTVFDILRKITEDGTTVLMVTHEEDAEHYADLIYKMDAGHIERQ